MDEEGISMEAFKEAFEKGNMFASGIGKQTPVPVICSRLLLTPISR